MYPSLKCAFGACNTWFFTNGFLVKNRMMLCAIWYHLYNFKKTWKTPTEECFHLFYIAQMVPHQAQRFICTTLDRFCTALRSIYCIFWKCICLLSYPCIASYGKIILTLVLPLNSMMLDVWKKYTHTKR